MNRHPNTVDYKSRSEPRVELESQYILRLPPVTLFTSDVHFEF